jgi:hypothetical protein
MTSEPWRIGILLYSGRPDPSWTIPAAQGEAWASSFERLRQTQAPIPDQSRLGYRGVWLQAPDGRRWFGYLSVAWTRNDRRADPQRVLERRLVASAPAGVLPGDWESWLVVR